MIPARRFMAVFSAKMLSVVVAVAVAAVLSASPADAKAGKSKSMGSRGDRTFSQQPFGSNAKPIERSVAPPAPPVAAPPIAPVQSETLAPPRSTMASPAPMAPPQQRPGFFQRHPFMGGMLAGVAGAGIASMLFGGHFFGEGMGGAFGAIAQILLIVGGVMLLMRFLRRGQGGAEMPPRQSPVAPSLYVAAPAATGVARQPQLVAKEFEPTQDDLMAFERLLQEVQATWTNGDEAGLRRAATSELAGYMLEQIADDRAQGLQNRVEQVRLLKGDVTETWREPGAEYVTVLITWSGVDYTVRTNTNQVVEGDLQHPQETTEVWTMVRRSGSPWQVTAIQQVNH